MTLYLATKHKEYHHRAHFIKTMSVMEFVTFICLIFHCIRSSESQHADTGTENASANSTDLPQETNIKFSSPDDFEENHSPNIINPPSTDCIEEGDKVAVDTEGGIAYISDGNSSPDGKDMAKHLRTNRPCKHVPAKKSKGETNRTRIIIVAAASVISFVLVLGVVVAVVVRYRRKTDNVSAAVEIEMGVCTGQSGNVQNNEATGSEIGTAGPPYSDIDCAVALPSIKRISPTESLDSFTTAASSPASSRSSPSIGRTSRAGSFSIMCEVQHFGSQKAEIISMISISSAVGAFATDGGDIKYDFEISSPNPIDESKTLTLSLKLPPIEKIENL